MLGTLQIAAGVALLGIILAAGHWNFFWIFFWLFLTLFGNGARQLNKGWNRWSEASSELKALGYNKPPVKDSAATGSLPPPESEPALPASGHDRHTPSVTESTTRRLDSPE
jgi:3-mercaptopyruvate sulfurtransferase SseA